MRRYFANYDGDEFNFWDYFFYYGTMLFNNKKAVKEGQEAIYEPNGLAESQYSVVTTMFVFAIVFRLVDLSLNLFRRGWRIANGWIGKDMYWEYSYLRKKYMFPRYDFESFLQRRLSPF